MCGYMYRIDERILEALNAHISRIAREEVKKALRNLEVETYKDVKISKTNDDGTVNTVDMVTGENSYNVVNSSGAELVSGDVVRIYSGNDDKKYVGIKM